MKFEEEYKLFMEGVDSSKLQKVLGTLKNIDDGIDALNIVGIRVETLLEQAGVDDKKIQKFSNDLMKIKDKLRQGKYE